MKLLKTIGIKKYPFAFQFSSQNQSDPLTKTEKIDDSSTEKIFSDAPTQTIFDIAVAQKYVVGNVKF
mgnify:CR=1 FL=1